MRRLLNWVFALAFIASFLFVGAGEALAAGELSDIQAAADEEAMEETMRDSDDLSDEVALLDELTDDVKAAVLGSVFRRRYTVEDMDSFKELFAAQYERKATFMSWSEGYPYATDASANGTNLVVKTDVDGWVYILSIPDNVRGGVSDEYSFMQLYEADNGIYKKKVWVQGGVETTITVSSASTGSGNSYRVYYCLRTGGNESGFGEVKYTSVETSLYDLWIKYHGLVATYETYGLYLLSSQACGYNIDISAYLNGVYQEANYGSGDYTNINNVELISALISEGSSTMTVENITYTVTITFEDGTKKTEYFYLETPDP